MLVRDPTAGPDHWKLPGGSDSIICRRCANNATPSACNWLTGVDGDTNELCVSCRLNRTIPDLSDDSNAERWRRIELAKRRLVSSLLFLGLPVISKEVEPETGLGFDFLRAGPTKVLTGHADGIITLNIDEADDARREEIRESLHEPYRTVLGHLRHEVGHYYWDRLVRGTKWVDGFREHFGDERRDYAEALRIHYENGPRADWQEHFVSAYASAHPWEDWAETWAHYLHMVDTLNTASSFSLDVESVEMPYDEFPGDTLCEPDDPFLHVVNSWVRLTAVLNELSRSMGLADLYPFVLTKSAIEKLHFVHLVIEAERASMRDV